MNIEGFITILMWFVCLWSTSWLLLAVVGGIAKVKEELQFRFEYVVLWSFFISWAWILSR